YYRLSVATIELPPLCDRPGDILPLARHFTKIYSGKMNMTGISLAQDAQAALLAYEWPGNIRELENVIHYALIVCRDQKIRADDLKLVGALHRNRNATETKIVAAPAAVNDARQMEASDEQALANLHRRLGALFGELIEAGDPNLFESVEESLIRTAFAWCHQNQVQSAKVLGISRNILRTHLKRFNLIGHDQGSAITEGVPAENLVTAH
ncbi:MAG: AAA-type ATPase lid domain-containing protein, partial [Burkholderiaceae bacterium]